MGRKTRNIDIKRSEMESHNEESQFQLGSLWNHEHKRIFEEHGPEKDIFNWLDKFVTNGKVLDYGSGGPAMVHSRPDGKLVSSIADDATAVGIDISRNLLLNEYETDNLIQGDAENLPFDSDTFEVVFSEAILHHLPNWRTDGLEEIKRILEPDGVLIFREPARYNPLAFVFRNLISTDDHTDHEKPFIPSKLKKGLLKEFGSVEIKGNYIISGFMPIVDNFSPVRIPHSVTKRFYDLEEPILENDYGISLSVGVHGFAHNL